MESTNDSPLPQVANGISNSHESSPHVQQRTSENVLYEWKDSPAKSDSGAEESLVNPPPPAELGEEECALLRGDAIGSTAYTQRWVLNTLLVITQALPQYIVTDVEEGCHAKSEMQNDRESEDMDSENSSEKMKESNVGDAPNTVLELAEDVENAACQLWDMTVEPDVVHHLLNLGAVDILQLATDIISLSRAPRLTEVVVGVVGNLCCQIEGCEKVVEHQALLNACLALTHTTDDVPTLIESFRFLRLLLWHLNNRVPEDSRIGCPLILALKGHEAIKVALIFILKNSLNDNLLSSLMEFLEILVYLWLPDDQCYMAAHYAESGLVEGVVEVMRHFLKQTEKKGGQELPKEVHKGILILYSFMGIKAPHLISSFDQYESLLEPILVCYIEHIAKAETVEELMEDENAERLTYALGLSELLVPTMRHPNIMLSIGRLLALTHGATHHYSTPKGKPLLETQRSLLDRKTRRRLRRRSSRRRSRSSQEQMDVESLDTEEVSNEGEEKRTGERFSFSERQNAYSLGLDISYSSSLPSESISNVRSESREPVARSMSHEDTVADRTDATLTSIEKDDSSENTKLNSLVESLNDYCVRVVKYANDLSAVFSALNECHVHEVQLFFRAVRSREPKLVGDLQEKLLDTGSHNRLVTILADMYT
ncbi:hypothetical protein SK128_000920 [Halocaridina rubra]|uniref:Protein saal1 n=1 Tax=Halocaridina rubra TaxID=373956 RepID=A0AAN9A4D2_HALRR